MVASGVAAASSSGSGGDQGSVLGDNIQLKIARLENEIADLEYESQQPVPYKLTAEEDALYYNEGKAHSARVAALEAHRGKAFSLIMGQCTQLLLDKMKQEKTWDVVSASYDPLELYKLIESVVLKQTEDQYPVAAMWDQYRRVFNAQQGTLSNTEFYRLFLTMIEVAESVGCKFANDKTLNYCAELKYKKAYESLKDDEKLIVDGLARDRFIGFGLVKASSNKHDHLKNALSDDYTKNDDKYPENGQQALLLLDRYSKKPAVVATSEGTSFAQKGKGGDKKKSGAGGNHPKSIGYDKEKFKDLE